MAGVTYVNTETDLKLGLSTVKNGTSRDLYMRLQVPEKYGWGAVGIGKEMIGSMIFLTYPSANGKSSTLSVRHAFAHAEPPPVKNQPCQVQEGVTQNGLIDTAFVCYGLGDPSTFVGPFETSDWIWATGPNIQVHSNSVDAQIQEHIFKGEFQLNMRLAEVNAPSKTGGSPSGTSVVPIVSGTNSVGSTGSEITTTPSYNLVKAHAVLLGGSFLVLFPLGIFLLRLRSTRLHWITQMFAFTLCIIGWIIALYMSASTTEFSAFHEAHQILGIISVCLLFPQAMLGFANHWKFKKSGKGTWMALPHVNLGRVAIICGMVTGILGFLLYDDQNGAIAYGVVAAVVLLAIVALTIFDMSRKSRTAKSVSSGDESEIKSTAQA